MRFVDFQGEILGRTTKARARANWGCCKGLGLLPSEAKSRGMTSTTFFHHQASLGGRCEWGTHRCPSPSPNGGWRLQRAQTLPLAKTRANPRNLLLKRPYDDDPDRPNQLLILTLDNPRIQSRTATMSTTPQRVQCFGKKKTATAVAQCKVRPPRKKKMPSTMAI